MAESVPIVLAPVERQKELLRFTTAGSVDDGKSTLIGRLLHDSNGAYEDQLASARRDGSIDFSLLTDGLRAEREQGITIDVAYRYFSTPRRKFIIADTPGHEQYTRNMATGASTAHLAVVLLDARKGVLPQSCRHACIAWLLGIPRLVVAVNKMDLVGFGEDVFDRICREFDEFLSRLDFREVSFIPISALEGDNVVARSRRMAWYAGPSLLERLETAPVDSGPNSALRFPVQYVIRAGGEFRGYAGQVASGEIRPGDTVMALPSGRTTRVKSIETFDGELPQAHPPMSVTVCLEDEIDLSRGDMLVDAGAAPHVSRACEAMLVWMHADALEVSRSYVVKHTTQQVRGTVTAILHKLDVVTLEKQPAARLQLNEIGAVVIVTRRPLYFDAYRRNRATGSFILIDPLTNATVAAGMIQSPQDAGLRSGRVTKAERFARSGHQPATVWLAGRKELAYLVERRLFDRGCMVHVLSEEIDGRLLAELRKLGVIAICTSASEPPESADLVPQELSSNDEEAAREVCRLLEEAGFIRKHERFADGEGI